MSLALSYVYSKREKGKIYMVDADSVAEDFRKFAAVGGAEIGVVEGAANGVFFLLGAEVGGEQVAGGVGAGILGEVDEINGRAALFVELGDFFLELGGGVFELERDRALVGLDEGAAGSVPRNRHCAFEATRGDRYFELFPSYTPSARACDCW